MSVLIETTDGNIVIDLFIQSEQILCYNFLKLCKVNHFFFTPFYNIHEGQYLQTGNPNYPSRDEESSNYSINKYVDCSSFCSSIDKEAEYFPVKSSSSSNDSQNNAVGLVQYVCIHDPKSGTRVVGSEISISLTPDLEDSLKIQPAFARVVEGFATLEKIVGHHPNESVPRILHTYVLDDPFPDPPHIDTVKRSTELPNETQIAHFKSALGQDAEALEDSTYRAIALELMDDLPQYDIKPSPRTLFVAKLNQITSSESLEIIFGRFGQVVATHVAKDVKTGKSLCFAFVEYSRQEEAEKAYTKLHKGCVIDGRQVVVDFSQSAKSGSR